MTKIDVPEALLKEIGSAQRFVLAGHMNPDGDSIGSGVALGGILRKLGKSSIFWNLNATPSRYEPLPGAEHIHVGSEPPRGFPDEFDSAIILECPTLDRTGLDTELENLPLLNIDHHMGNANYGRVNWIDVAAPALGEMLQTLAKRLGVAIDEGIGNALFLAVSADTGGFRFNNADQRAFECAAELVRSGAKPQRVSTWIYENRHIGAVRLVGESLASLELHDGGRIATVLVTDDMIERAGASGGDTEGLIDHPRSIEGVEAAALLRQVADGYKVSLRSRDSVDVERVARAHGGGGHRNAAGFLSIRAVRETLDLVVAELAKALDAK
ncbi:MAG: bifunctional oligoribonuclease/PAP phosphatase NrnA [Acidobacteriota bacterium]|nr:bifunctional oligoribonuclease/PAP phosphatase NrnA [Acidobacteriota bacterium]